MVLMMKTNHYHLNHPNLPDLMLYFPSYFILNSQINASGYPVFHTVGHLAVRKVSHNLSPYIISGTAYKTDFTALLPIYVSYHFDCFLGDFITF